MAKAPIASLPMNLYQHTQYQSPSAVEYQQELDTIHYTTDKILIGHKKAISSVNFSYSGQILASSSNDRTVRLWDVNTGKHTSSLLGHQLGISDVSWSHDSTLLATASDDTTVKIWDYETNKSTHTLKGHTNYVMCVGFKGESDTVLASGSFDQTVRLWDLRATSNCLFKLQAHKEMVVSANFDATGTKLVTAGFDGYVKIWDAKTGDLLDSFLAYDDKTPVCFAKWSPNGKFILVGSFDGSWKLISTSSGKPTRTYTGHQFNDYCLFASFLLINGKRIVSGSADKIIYIWDINSTKILQRLKGHDDVVVAVSVHPSVELIASGSLDRNVRLWKSSYSEPEGEYEEEPEGEHEDEPEAEHEVPDDNSEPPSINTEYSEGDENL